MILKTRFFVKRTGSKWELFEQDKNNRSTSYYIDNGTKKYCRSIMATLKRQEFLSSTSDAREAQRRELREGAE